jgi:hypothetical protein
MKAIDLTATEPRIAAWLVAVMLVQSLLGLLLPNAYRDADWIRAAWYGNDWMTLVAAVPLLCFGILRVGRGSVRGLLLVLGTTAYAIYNYAFYLFGAALNVFFLLYIAGLLLGSLTLALFLSHPDVSVVARALRPETTVRLLGGYLVFLAVGLATVWLGLWSAYAFGGRPTPIDPEAFKVVAALDLSLMVPVLAVGGVLLWKRRPWGYVIATVSAIQGSLYLLVLSVGSTVAISRGLAVAPGELPIWGPLAAFTSVAAVVLVRSASKLWEERSRSPL